MDIDLVDLGRVALVTTRGRRTGLDRPVAIGYVDGPDGCVLVAATEASSAWAANLEAEPRCTVRIGDRKFAGKAERLEGADHADAVRQLILRYGTTAERLGRGPSFRLCPVEAVGD